jgi:hypothetical protein
MRLLRFFEKGAKLRIAQEERKRIEIKIKLGIKIGGGAGGQGSFKK